MFSRKSTLNHRKGMNVLYRGLTDSNFPKDFTDKRSWLRNKNEPLLQSSHNWVIKHWGPDFDKEHWNYDAINRQDSDFVNQYGDWDYIMHTTTTPEDVMAFRRHVYGDWWDKGQLDWDLMTRLKGLERRLPMNRRREYSDLANKHQLEFVKHAFRRGYGSINPHVFNREAPIMLSNIRNAESDSDKLMRKALASAGGDSPEAYLDTLIDEYKEHTFKPVVREDKANPPVYDSDQMKAFEEWKENMKRMGGI